ncbi:nuclear transport factor 2 family protein [Pseudorhodobacter sp.]|uniref:nuclear transport factor 2 family protein n=1 Tax=Pseudorhodobacter sp. TaxID=1934400 RepID=UPI002AFE6F59|nr:nuclear transport factor 2 family protein [Pseudorhodobacter sp.]
MGLRPPVLAELADMAALQRLVTAYSRAIDRRDFALLESLYHPDATDSHGQMFVGGVAGYLDFVRVALSRYEMTVHYVVNTLFDLQGDRAEGEIHKINYHRTHGPQAIETTTGSRSLDHYSRRNGEWRFQSRSVVIDWAETRPANPAAWDDFAAQSPRGQAGAQDASYSLLPLLRRFGP